MFGKLRDSLGKNSPTGIFHCPLCPSGSHGEIFCNMKTMETIRRSPMLPPKPIRDESGDHPDAAWIITSFGPDRTRNFLSSATFGIVQQEMTFAK